MFKHDGEEAIGALIGLFFAVAVICIVIYVTVMLITIIAGIFAACGTVYGGGYAIKNYASSFKENIIDSNRASAMAA